MSDEKNVICEKAKTCLKRGETCAGMKPHKPQFVSENKTCTTAHLCAGHGMVKCVPVTGEEKER